MTGTGRGGGAAAGGADLAADVAVAGGGIVGMATAMALLRAFPGLGVVVLDKERSLGRHQTGRNSGVIHSGIYYRPGSLKARLCRDGGGRLRDFCRDAGVRSSDCGKVIVATAPSELPALDRLEERGRANGVPGVRVIGPGELAEIEPSAAGIRALHVPATGIVDFGEVLRAMADRVGALGGRVVTNAEVIAVRRSVGRSTVFTSAGKARVRLVVNCAGLYADRVAAMAGARPAMRIIPFRGEYFTLLPAPGREIRGLVYPVPDPTLPFLGVHVTRGIQGDVHVGPNAVLALAREGYTRTTVRLGELWDTVRFPGFWALARRYWRTGIAEFARSFSGNGFARAVSRLVPGVTPADLRSAPAGVRAQALARDGRLVDDFWIARTPGAIHVLNAPSPAATASIVIGEHVAALAGEALGASGARS